MDWMERIAETYYPHYIIGGVSDDGQVIFGMQGMNSYKAALELARLRIAARQPHQQWWCTVYHLEPVAEVRIDDGAITVTDLQEA